MIYEEINTEEDSPVTYSYMNAPFGLYIMENHYYCFGQLWDGDGGDSKGKELLDSGAIEVFGKNNSPFIIHFQIYSPCADYLDTVVRVFDII